MIKEIILFIRKELSLDIRSTSSLLGLFLYVFACVYIFKSLSKDASPEYWNAFLWITGLFVCINAVSKSFIGESQSRYLYYFQLARPISLFISKIIYNTFILSLLMMVGVLCMKLFSEVEFENMAALLLSIVLGAISFSVPFSFVSSIVSKTDANHTMLVLLAFPIVIGSILVLSRISGLGIGVIENVDIQQELITITGINGLMIGLSLILFPIIWRE